MLRDVQATLVVRISLINRVYSEAVGAKDARRLARLVLMVSFAKRRYDACKNIDALDSVPACYIS